MAAKTVCSVPADWTFEEYSRHTCFDGSHQHLSFSRLVEIEKQNVVIWLRRRATRREKDVVKIYELPIPRTHAGPQKRPALGAAMRGARGLSGRVGPYLAKRIRQRHAFALVMFAQISMRPGFASADGVGGGNSLSAPSAGLRPSHARVAAK